MTAAHRITEIDTRTYWVDVRNTLVAVCGLAPEAAEVRIRELRRNLSCQSRLGQLLTYHDGVPCTAKDIWRATLDEEPNERKLEDRQRSLVQWYNDELARRGGHSS